MTEPMHAFAWPGPRPPSRWRWVCRAVASVTVLVTVVPVGMACERIIDPPCPSTPGTEEGEIDC
jgi:hypothetical protein